MRHVVTGLMLTLTLGGEALARSDQDVFSKLLGRVASAPDVFKPRIACACADGTPGYLVQVPALNAPIVCVVPEFDPEGAFIDGMSCPGDFKVLGR